MKYFGLMLFAFLIASCSDKATTSQSITPKILDRQATGYYSQMILLDQKGSKGQIWLSDQDQPIWFSSVKDTLFFTKNPEEADNIRTIFVSIYQKDPTQKSAWITLDQATLVIGSDIYNAMGFKDVIVFADKESAEQFIQNHGGEVVKSADISLKYLTDSTRLTPN